MSHEPIREEHETNAPPLLVLPLDGQDHLARCAGVLSICRLNDPAYDQLAILALGHGDGEATYHPLDPAKARSVARWLNAVADQIEARA